MLTWSTHPRFYQDVVETYSMGAVSCHYQIVMGEHCGTHMDAPSHFVLKDLTIVVLTKCHLPATCLFCFNKIIRGVIQMFEGYQLVDLTLTLDEKFPCTWPGTMIFQKKKFNWYEEVNTVSGVELNSKYGAYFT